MNKYLLSELSESEVRWSMSYVGLSWAAELGNGAIQTITGNQQREFKWLSSSSPIDFKRAWGILRQLVILAPL